MPRPELPDRAVAAVVTAFRIGPVLADTLMSLLEQRDISLARVVLVVDGCPLHQTTSRIAERFGRRFPEFRTIWLENGGVSRARNVGVRSVLEDIPEVDAIFLLDGDDLIPPKTLVSTLGKLDQARQTPGDLRPGWVYFDQMQFGAEEMALRYPSTFAPSRWLASNLSQPSCLYAADMFRAGVAWDEDMRHGIEDWEFWHSALAAGFYGVHDADVTLKYRRLTGNRSSLNRAKDSLTKRYMRTKHAQLLTPKALLSAEAQAHPRWAIRAPEEKMWRLTNDPVRHGQSVGADLALSACVAREAQYARDAVFLDPYFPDLVAIVPADTRRALARQGLLRTVFWTAERALAETPVAVLRTEDGSKPVLRQDVVRESPAGLEGAAAIFASTTALARLLRTDVTDCGPPRGSATRTTPPRGGLIGLLRRKRRMEASGSTREVQVAHRLPDTLSVTRLDITLPELSHEGRAVGAFAEEGLNAIAQMLVHARDLAGDPAYLRSENRYCGTDKANHPAIWRELLGVLPPLPVPLQPGHVNVAMIVPADTGRPPGWVLDALSGQSGLGLHLISTGDQLPDTVSLGLSPGTARSALDVPLASREPGHDLTYFGTPLFEKTDSDWQARAVSLLAGMDVVVNAAGPVMAGPMMMLKKFGVRTALCAPQAGEPDLSSDEDAPSDIAAGDVHAVVTYTAAYTHILCQTAAVALRLRALGVQRAVIDIAALRLLEDIQTLRGDEIAPVPDLTLARAS